MRQQILEVLISSSVLILALALLRILLRGKISPRLQFGLWLLVAVRLLVPVSIGQSAASVMNYVPQQQMTAILEDAAIPAQVPQVMNTLPMEEAAISNEALPLEASRTAQEASTASEDSAEESAQFSPAPLTICYYIWGIGAVLALIVMLGQNAVLAARLKRNRVRLEVPECKNSVYITKILPSSCLFGLFRPAIYITPQALNADGTPNTYVLLHEQTHYRRRDHIWCALRLLLLAMYWFDPFVWLAARLSKIDCELACDDLALRRLDDGARIAYGRTLLDQISIKRAPMQAALCATTMVSGKKTLRARIRLIAKKPKMTAVTLILVVGVCLLLAACMFTNSAADHTASTPDLLPPLVQVDGTLYQLTNENLAPEDAVRVVRTGTIKHQLDDAKTPNRDDQANFSGKGWEYGVLDGQLVIEDQNGNWMYTLVNLPNDEVHAAILRETAPNPIVDCDFSPCRLGTIVTAKRTNEDASLDAILMLAQKVDGEIQVTQMETGHVDDSAGYGVFQTQMAGQTIVFGIADRRMRETNSGEMTSVNFNSVMLRFTEGSVSSSLAASPGETFQIGTYGDAEITSVRLALGQKGDVAIFMDIPAPGEDRLATMTLGENWADTAEEASDEPALTAEEEEAIRTAVYDKFSEALWVLTTEDEARTFTGADSRKNGMVGNFPHYYGTIADYFVATGKPPVADRTWAQQVVDDKILKLTIWEASSQEEVVQHLYYSLETGTLCGMRQEPELTADMSIGVGITTDYADEDFVVFHGYFGLFVYDLQQSRMALALDPGAAFGTNNMQGSSGYMVSAYKDGDAVKVIATFYDSMQGMLSPVSYYYDTASDALTFSPTAPAGVQTLSPAHTVAFTDQIADLTYSDGETTWKLFDGWKFGAQADAKVVPLTAPEKDASQVTEDDFYDIFWELDRDSMQSYLDAHPEVLSNGWAGININESGLSQSGTSIRTTMGEQVLAVNFREKVLLVRVAGEKYRGVLAVAKVPARLSVEMSEGLGSYGQTVGEIAEAHGGLLSMTCNGFLDPGGQGNGGELAGFAMSDGVPYGEHYSYTEEFPYARFEILTDNTVCIRRSNEGVRADCRDATEFNPALIIDGVIFQSSYWTSEAPRACIGQSSRQEMLLLVIEGRMPESGILGTSVNECSAILARHGAVQAMNVDGGTSAIMWYDGQYVTRCNNLALPGGRALPNAFVYHRRTS